MRKASKPQAPLTKLTTDLLQYISRLFVPYALASTLILGGLAVMLWMRIADSQSSNTPEALFLPVVASLIGFVWAFYNFVVLAAFHASKKLSRQSPILKLVLCIVSVAVLVASVWTFTSYVSAIISPDSAQNSLDQDGLDPQEEQMQQEFLNSQQAQDVQE